MGYYYINSSLLCTVIIGAAVLLLESIALEADVQFTNNYLHNLETDSVCLHFINKNKNGTGHRDFNLLRRDLPFEPIFLVITSVALVICITSLAVSWIFRNTRFMMIMMMNKFMMISLVLTFCGCCTLICASFIIYDLNYMIFNEGETTGCNMNYNHEYAADKDCDRKYSVCQRKDLKAAAFLLSAVCILLGISGLLRELRAKNTTKAFEDIFSREKSFMVDASQDNDTASTTSAQDRNSIGTESLWSGRISA